MKINSDVSESESAEYRDIFLYDMCVGREMQQARKHLLSKFTMSLYLLLDMLINIAGKVTGVVNDINVGVGDLAAFISQHQGELFVSIDSISQMFGHSFQMVPPLTGLLGWIFGKSLNGKTGYDIVGNRFKSTSIIMFKTGK